jgi:hypothetical protein
MSGLDDCTSVLEDILDFLKEATEPKSPNKKFTAFQSDDSDDDEPTPPVQSERIENYEDKDVPYDRRIPLAFSSKGPQKTPEGLDREHQKPGKDFCIIDTQLDSFGLHRLGSAQGCVYYDKPGEWQRLM